MKGTDPKTAAARVLALLVATAALACGGTPPSLSSSSSPGISGTYAGTLATTGVCGSGNLTVTISQGGENLWGTWTTTGFSTTAPCTLNWSGGAASGAMVGSVVSLTLAQGSQAFRLVGTYAADTIIGTFTQTFSTGSGVSSGGTFSLTQQ